jgi:hypothetical protein
MGDGPNGRAHGARRQRSERGLGRRLQLSGIDRPEQPSRRVRRRFREGPRYLREIRPGREPISGSGSESPRIGPSERKSPAKPIE